MTYANFMSLTESVRGILYPVKLFQKQTWQNV